MVNIFLSHVKITDAFVTPCKHLSRSHTLSLFHHARICHAIVTRPPPLSHALSCCHPLSLSYSHILTLNVTLSHSRSHSDSQCHSLTFPLSRSHILTLTHCHSLTHSRTHPLSGCFIRKKKSFIFKKKFKKIVRSTPTVTLPQRQARQVVFPL